MNPKPLSPKRLLSFLTILHRLDLANQSQFIIATHSPILFAYLGAPIFHFSESGIQNISDYRDLEHFHLTRDFLNNPELYFRHLFTEI